MKLSNQYRMIISGFFKSKPALRQVDLGGGFTLVEAKDFKLVKDASEWSLFYKNQNAGYLSTYMWPDIGYVIKDTYVVDSFRGKGLGEKMVRALVGVYGSLSSDPEGIDSEDAIRMWKRMGAEKVPTDLNRRKYFYRLTK